MKIIDTTTYEKLKIRPVDIQSLQNGICKTSPYNIKMQDLKPGWFVKTKEGDENFYMVVTRNTEMKFIDFQLPEFPEYYLDICFMQPSTENNYGFLKLYSSSYKALWPIYKNDSSNKFTIEYVYKTNIDTSNMKNIKDFTKTFYENLKYIKDI